MSHTELPLAAGKLVELRASLFGFRETRPTHHIYLLFDNGCPVPRNHPLHPDQLALRSVARRIAPLPMSNSARGWQPFLLQFYEAGENGYPDEALLELSLGAACERHASINGTYMAAWIGSDLEPAALATHLARHCEQFDVLQGRRRRLPLYEPHRMALLVDDPVAADFLRGFLAKTPFWAFVDGAGALRTLVPTGAGPQPFVSGGGMGTDVIAAQRRVSLARVALLGVVKAEAIIPAQVERKLDALLVAAEQVGLFDAEDVVFFALNGLSVSPQWHLHPVAKQCIARAVGEKAPLAGLLAELSDAVLDEIGAYRAA